MKNNNYVSMTSTPTHHLTQEPENLTFSEVLFSYGFIKIMSIIWTPFFILLVIYVVISKKIKKRC